jgi:hypothetical protein
MTWYFTLKILDLIFHLAVYALMILIVVKIIRYKK